MYLAHPRSLRGGPQGGYTDAGNMGIPMFRYFGTWCRYSWTPIRDQCDLPAACAGPRLPSASPTSARPVPVRARSRPNAANARDRGPLRMLRIASVAWPRSLHTVITKTFGYEITL